VVIQMHGGIGMNASRSPRIAFDFLSVNGNI
jgi:hypothetical protein